MLKKGSWIPAFARMTVGERAMAAVAILFGVEFVADRYGVGRWFRGFIQLCWIAVGVKVVWVGGRALISKETASFEEAAPRYADRGIRIVSPRADAAFQILCGVLLILMGSDRIIQILKGA